MQRREALGMMAAPLFAQADRKIRLIVQGDDMGVARAVNEGTISAYRNGVMRTTNVIVPGAWFLDAVEMLAENPELDAGVHLCLSSEWTHVKWGPLTRAKTIVDANGYFPPLIRGNDPARPALANMPFSLAEVEAEFRAQIEMAKKHIPRVSYLWGHMGCTNVTPAVAELTAKLAAEYKLPVPGAAHGIERIGRVWEKPMNGEQRADAFVKKMEELKPGTWLFVEHASLDTPESRRMGHPGYEDVARDRQAVHDGWTHPKVKAAVARLGIELASHANLQK